MTATRHRRSPEDQAADILKAKLHRLDDQMLKLQEKHSALDARAEPIRKALETLATEPLPEVQVLIPTCILHGYTIHDITAEPAQDVPPAQRLATPAPAAESVGAETPQGTARATPTKCKHGKVQGWCIKAECQERITTKEE